MRLQDARTRVAAPLIALAVGVLGGTPASAETIATGSVMLTTGANTYATPEVLAYVAEGCDGHHTDALVQAVIDVRQYQGGKILLSDAGLVLGVGGARQLNYAFLDRCEPQPILSNRSEYASPGVPLEIEVEAEYLVLSAAGATGTNYGVGFKVEAL